MLPDLYFRITAQGNTTAAFAKTKAEVRGVKAEMAGLASTAASALRSFGLFAGVGGLGLVARSARDAIREVGDLADASDRAGVSAEKLQVLRFALEQTAGSAEDSAFTDAYAAAMVDKVRADCTEHLARLGGALAGQIHVGGHMQ